MNYRHAYHAGSHIDVFKHAVLVMLLEHLRRKPKPFTVLDTHAGAGRYDLTAVEAGKTGEAADGIGRVIGKDIPAAAAYLDLIRHLNPDGLRYLSGVAGDRRGLPPRRRPADRLRTARGGSRKAPPRTSAATRGSPSTTATATRRSAPSCRLPSRRGLVFIDPPYEKDDRDAYRRVAERMNAGLRKWPARHVRRLVPAQGPGRDRARSGRPTAPATRRRLRSSSSARRSMGRLRRAAACSSPTRPSGSSRRLKALGKELLAAFDAPKGSLSLDWWIPET